MSNSNALGERAEQDRSTADAKTIESNDLQAGQSFAQSEEAPLRKKRLNIAKRGFAKLVGRIGKDKGEDLVMTERGGKWSPHHTYCGRAIY
jgi:hypothetical protein